MRSHHGWPIGRRCCYGLNAGLLIIRDRHHAQLLACFAPLIFIDDLDLLVNVQHASHFDFEVRVPFLHVVSNPVWSQFALLQDSVEFGATQSEQCRMPGRDAVLAYVSDQQLIRPQFVGVSQFLRLLAGAVLYPGNRIVRQLPRLARSGQLSQCRIKTELKTLLNAEHHGATADVVVLRDGFVTLAGQRIQKKSCPKRAPLFLGSRLANGLQLEHVLLAELDETALPREGHDPLKHKSGEMYRYLENEDLESAHPNRSRRDHACRKSSEAGSGPRHDSSSLPGRLGLEQS